MLFDLEHVILRTAILFIIIGGCFPSCKKKDSSIPNNNQFKATVIRTNGSPVEINAVTTKALMGCGMLGAGTFVSGTSDAGASVDLVEYLATPPYCVTTPGTYTAGFRCEYRPTPNAIPYENFSVPRNRSSITFTKVSDTEMEGNFNAVCWLNADSVVVSGTFKGNKLSH